MLVFFGFRGRGSGNLKFGQRGLVSKTWSRIARSRNRSEC